MLNKGGEEEDQENSGGMLEKKKKTLVLLAQDRGSVNNEFSCDKFLKLFLG